MSQRKALYQWYQEGRKPHAPVEQPPVKGLRGFSFGVAAPLDRSGLCSLGFRLASAHSTIPYAPLRARMRSTDRSMRSLEISPCSTAAMIAALMRWMWSRS